MDFNRLLEKKRVFINGGQRGIGKDIALLFASQGATIALGGRDKQTLEKTMKEIKEISPNSKGYLLDVSTGEELERVCLQVLEDFGGIDIIINTIGVNKHGYTHELTDDDLERMLETNYKSTIRSARKFLPGMMERRWGTIVNISSIHSVQTMPRYTSYAGTKGAMNAAARSMALEYAPYNIRVNNLAPGLIFSDNMMDEINAFQGEEQEAFIKLLESMQPLPPGSMADVSNAALFLASDLSSYITGQTLLVDGGATVKAH